jgi:acetyl esterase/lipase
MQAVRIRTAVGALALGLTVLAACGSSEPTSSGGSTSPASTSAATPSTSPANATTTPPMTTLSTAAKGVARSSAETKTGVAYATKSAKQTLDLYLPASDGSKAVPVVVLIHGGAFKAGSSAMEAAHGRALAAKGIAAVAVNYRLSGEALFPAGAQDVKAAVRWVRANAATYGVDPTRVGAWGASAGGWMANMLGATGDQATVFDDASLGNADQSTAVQAVVSWFGPTNFASMDAQATETKCAKPDVHGTADSPESLWLGEAVATSTKVQLTNLPGYVASAKVLPPWFLAHGDSDCQVTPGQSMELKAALEKRGAAPVFTIVAGAAHGGAVFEQTQLTPTVDFLVAKLVG